MDRSKTEERILSILNQETHELGVDWLREMSAADWEELLRRSDRYGISPLLYQRLAACPAAATIPPDVIRTLRNSYLQSSSRNLQLYHELGKVLGRLRQEGIAVLALKGAHLAEVVYGNSALRPMNDVDLLVHREDLGQVEKHLLELGYLPMDCNRLIADDNRHFAYSLPNKGLTVEIHWALLPADLPFDIDMDGQWQRSRKEIIGTVEVAVLSPEDLLLHLCLHAAHHLFEIWLKPFCDIFATIQHYGDDIDWDQVRIRSGQAGINNAVYLSLQLARELLGAAVPVELLAAIKPDDFDERFIAMAKDRIFESEERSVDGLSLTPNVAQIFGSQRMMAKAKLFLNRVFPSREEMTRNYPASVDSLRIYLYYPVRIWELLLRHGRQVLRLLPQEEGMRNLLKQEEKITPLREWLMSSSYIPEEHAGARRSPAREGSGLS